MKRIYRYISGHFSRLQSLNKWSFICRLWLEATIIAYIVGTAVQAIFPAAPRADLQNLTPLHLIALVAVVGPLFETVAFQYLPLELTAALGFRRSVRLFISIVPFAAMHYFAGMPTVVAAGAVGGFYFAFTYERWKKESVVVAVIMTFLLHSSFNLVGVVGMLFLR